MRAAEGPNEEKDETAVNLEGDRRQKSRQLELPWEGRGEAPSVPRSDESLTAVQGTERPGADGLMEKVLDAGTCRPLCGE